MGGGKKGMDVFIGETDPSLVAFELDLGWARVASQDPVQWFNRYPGRFPMWHVKDIKGLKEAQDRQTEAFRNPPPPPQQRPAGAPPAGGPPAGGPPAGGPPPGGPPAMQTPPPGSPAPDGPAPIGLGELDYRPICAGWRAAGLEHWFLEQDLAARWPGGALESLRTSYANVKRLLA